MTDRENAEQAWAQCCTILQNIIEPDIYNMWFVYIMPVSLVGVEITLGVPSQYFYEYIEANFYNELKYALEQVVSPGVVLKYKITVDSTAPTKGSSYITLPTGAAASTTGTAMAASASAKIQTSGSADEDFDSQLNPTLSFATFCSSESNRVAYSVAKSIADSPGKGVYNPYFIYGHSGVGKTHLCHAIGLRIRELYPRLRVLYISSHLFEQQYTSAARANTINDFISFYQQIDVLLIDDIQFLIGKKKTQLTFFQVFNHLYMLGKQIVLTSDQPPANLAGMEERLVSRMAGSLTVELGQPDIELRRQILLQKSQDNGIALSRDVIDFIAENVRNNVRELEGVFLSLITFAAVDGCNITLSFVKKIVKQAVKLEKKEVSVPAIEEIICKHFNVRSEDVRSKSRKQEVVMARQVIMYLAKKYTDQSLTAIGEQLGGRTHATVLHSCKVVEDQLKISARFQEEMTRIEALLK